MELRKPAPAAPGPHRFGVSRTAPGPKGELEGGQDHLAGTPARPGPQGRADGGVPHERLEVVTLPAPYTLLAPSALPAPFVPPASLASPQARANR